MGRAGGPPSIRSSDRSKKIGQVRTKRKKRKRDLEELHRNVIEAKRCARIGATQNRRKWKTNFAKVLNNFADKRRENEEGKETCEDGKSRRKKPRTICDRLLPKPMVGMYQNGAKGREIRRGTDRLNEMNVARLRGNVLKLLKGDETNFKSSWERETDGNEEMPNPVRPFDDSDESDCQIVKFRHVKDPVHGNTKGGGIVKPTKREGLKTSKVREEETSRIETGNEATEFVPRQRDEDKCRRRLFELDEDEDESTKNSFGIIDPPMMTDHEIRSSPSRIKRFSCPKTSNILDDERQKKTCLRNGKFLKDDDNDETQPDKRIDGSTINANFWGRSPVSSYERLCAEISIRNFEDKPYHQQRDPIVKVRNILRGLFIQNGRSLRGDPKKLSTNPGEPEGGIPWGTIRSSTSENEIFQACTETSEMDQGCSSSETSTTMIGSWRPNKIQRRVTSIDETTSLFDEKSENEKNVGTCSSSDVVEKTINSVSAFLKQFQDHNPLGSRRERNVFEMEIDRESGTSDEKLDACPETPPRDAKLPDVPKCAPRKFTMKHVPAILRRSAENTVRIDQNLHGFLPSKIYERVPEQRIPDNGNFVFSNLQTFGPRETGSIRNGNVSSDATSILREPSYYHYGTVGCETSKESAELPRHQNRPNPRKSKLNLTRAYETENPRLSENREAKSSQGNDYADAPIDRRVEATRRDFSRITNASILVSKNRSVCQNQLEIMDFQSDEAVPKCGNVERPGRKVRFFNDSNGFFETNEWKKADVEPGVQLRNIDSDARIGEADNTPADHPGHHRSNPSDDGRFPSFEFPLADHSDHHRSDPTDDGRFPSFEFPPPEVDRRFYRSNDPRNVGGNKVYPGNIQDSLSIPAVSNNTEPSLGLLNSNGNSRLVNQPGGSDWRYFTADLDSISSEKPVQGFRDSRSLEKQRSVYGNPSKKPNGGPVDEHQRGISRRPVVLFRPIEHSRQIGIPHSQQPDPRRRDDPETTAMGDATRNLRMMAFDGSIPEGHPSRRSNRTSYRYNRNTRNSPVRCSHQIWSESGYSSNQPLFESFESHGQPAKFVAYERTDGGNPRRIPIYGKFCVPNALPAGTSGKRGATELLMNTDDGEQKESLYVGSMLAPTNEHKAPSGRLVERTTESFVLTAGRRCLYDKDSTVLLRSESELDENQQQHRSRRVALMMPIPTLRYHQSKMAPPAAPPPSTFEPTISKESHAPGIIYGLDDRGRRPQPSQIRYEAMESPFEASIAANRRQNIETNINFCHRTDTLNLSERVQLPDGRIGLLLTGHSNMGKSSQGFNANTGPTSNAQNRVGRPDPTTDATCLFEFDTNDGICYSQPDHRRNTGYDANEAYRRLARANGVPDTFTGI